MKLTGAAAKGFLARPPADTAGALIFGADPARVSEARRDLVTALVGKGAEDEMRLTRIAGPDLRKDPAQLIDALKAQGFFPGPRAVVVTEVTDTLARPVSAALDAWAPGDAALVVTAGALQARSALRKAFEAHPSAAAIGIYDTPPDRAEIEAWLAEAGAGAVGADAMAALQSLARVLEPGDLRQTIEKLALYRLDAEGEASAEDVAAVAPAMAEAGLDEALAHVAEGRHAEIGPVLRRLATQGVQPVTLCIGALRHFRTLHAIASHPGGAAQGVAQLRPPVYGPRRDRLARQASQWGTARLETALELLVDTDLELRSAGQTAPARALVERCFIRLAMLAQR